MTGAGELRRCGLLLAIALLAARANPVVAGTVMGFDFGRSLAPWSVLGEGGRLEAGNEPVDGVRTPVLTYRYAMGQGKMQLLTLPVPVGALAKADAWVFRAKPSEVMSLVVTLEEQGGGRWTASLALPAGRWSAIRLVPGDFVCSTGPDDPRDPNGRLDMDKVRLVSVVDAAAFVAATSADAMRFFSIGNHARSVQLTDMAFKADGGPAGGSAASLDAFDAPQPMWLAMGLSSLSYAVGGPLPSQGLNARYERKPAAAAGLMRRLSKGALAGADRLTLKLASKSATTLLLKLEQADGGKFETKLRLPGDSQLHRYVLSGKDFEASDDSAKASPGLNWSDVDQLSLMDIGGFLSPRGANQVWLGRIESNAALVPPGAAPALVPGAAKGTVSVATPGWSTWTKRVDPIHSGPVPLVGDPSVMLDGPILRMVYNCFDTARKRGAVCEATSKDGLSWADLPNNDSPAGRLIKTRPGQWDDAQETPFMVKYRGEYLLYFVGYRDKGGFFKSFPAHVGMAVSRDGVNFDRPILDPVLKTTPGGYDNDAISSPSVVEYGSKLVMLYTAHCWTHCPQGTGMTLMSATSTDGRVWTKGERPVLTKADFPKAKDGMAEAEVARGPDGQYYLFFSLFYGDGNGHDIGVARAPSPFGPWDIDPEPVVRRSAGGFDAVGPVAPSVVFDGGRVRMWFHGFSKRNTIEIGYAEAPWPLRTK
jgi:hypothetical protein